MSRDVEDLHSEALRLAESQAGRDLEEAAAKVKDERQAMERYRAAWRTAVGVGIALVAVPLLWLVLLLAYVTNGKPIPDWWGVASQLLMGAGLFALALAQIFVYQENRASERLADHLSAVGPELEALGRLLQHGKAWKQRRQDAAED